MRTHQTRPPHRSTSTCGVPDGTTMQLHPAPTSRAGTARPTRSRLAWADNLKLVLVVGVIVGHATMAWTGVGNWVFEEPHLREPLLTLLIVVSMVGAAFAMPLFFLLAGAFTPASLARKGPARFLADRTLRLGVPVVFYVVLLSPIIEYADPDAAGWDRGFLAFTWHIWWPPAWGPTWFLVVLLAFSALYVAIRTLAPRHAPGTSSLHVWHLLVLGVALTLACYLVRIWVPIGEEPMPLRFALAQSPGWVLGFVLGVLGGERGWFDPLDPVFARRIRHASWAALAVFPVVFGSLLATGVDLDLLAGGGTPLSLLTAATEATLIVTVPFWVLDVFQRRLDHQGQFARTAGRAAFAAFVLHQLVLVGLVLATHSLLWPPEVEYLLVSTLGVAGAFGLALLLLRVPGVARIV
jgi:glucans biosynthesis protein C